MISSISPSRSLRCLRMNSRRMEALELQSLKKPLTKGSFKLKINLRKCLNPCTRDPLPSDPKAPEPPEEAKIGQSPRGDDGTTSSDPDSENYVAPKLDGEEEDEGPSTHALLIKCADTLEQLKLTGPVGKSYRAYCPKECSKTEKFIFGTQLYHPYSSVCRAAIHDGKITDDGGEFILFLANLPHLLHGTNQNQL